jgi:hypothetical protein
VPAVSEVISNFDLATIVGLFARPGVPQAAVDKITAEAIAAVNSPAAEKQLRAAGIEPAGGNAEALGRALKREIDKVNEVVKNAGIDRSEDPGRRRVQGLSLTVSMGAPARCSSGYQLVNALNFPISGVIPPKA